MLENAGLMAKSHHWGSEEEMTEYMDIIAKFAQKIKEETNETC